MLSLHEAQANSKLKDLIATSTVFEKLLVNKSAFGMNQQQYPPLSLEIWIS